MLPLLIISNCVKLLQNLPGFCKQFKNINKLCKFCIKCKKFALKCAKTLKESMQNYARWKKNPRKQCYAHTCVKLPQPVDLFSWHWFPLALCGKAWLLICILEDSVVSALVYSVFIGFLWDLLLSCYLLLNQLPCRWSISIMKGQQPTRLTE